MLRSFEVIAVIVINIIGGIYRRRNLRLEECKVEVRTQTSNYPRMNLKLMGRERWRQLMGQETLNVQKRLIFDIYCGYMSSPGGIRHFTN